MHLTCIPEAGPRPGHACGSVLQACGAALDLGKESQRHGRNFTLVVGQGNR